MEKRFKQPACTENLRQGSMRSCLNLVLLLLCFFGEDSNAQSECPLKLVQELPAYLKLSPEDFDLNNELGWRRLAADQCFSEAAQALDAYIDLKRSPYHVYFHAAQMHAVAGNYSRARFLLPQALRPELGEDNPFKWNEYVRAVDAFLANDIDGLKLERQKMASRADVTGNAANLKVVDQLIAKFGQPYGTIFK